MQMGVALNAPPRRAWRANNANCARRGQPQILFASRAPPQRARWASTAIALEEPHQMLHASLAPTCQNVAGQARNQRTLLLEALYAVTTMHGRPLRASEERAQTFMSRIRAPSARRVHFPLPVVLGECFLCVSGTYQAQEGLTVCNTCPANSHSPVQSTASTACTCKLGGRAPMAEERAPSVSQGSTRLRRGMLRAPAV